MIGILICSRCGKEIALRAFGLKCGCKDGFPMPVGISGILEVRDEQEWNKKGGRFKKVIRRMYNVMKGRP